VLKSDYGLDLSSHRSQLLSQSDVDAAHFIVPVKRNLCAHIQQTFTDAGPKLRYLSKDIPDPWHQPVEIFRQCALTINECLDEFLSSTHRQID
jgi:protein-tyrosine-phosphatase